MELTSKQRAQLRGLANSLTPIVHIGKEGITEAVVKQTDEALEAAVTADPEKAKKYATLLYDQALLIAGLPLEDPSGYTDLVCELMK